ncbi:MAG TPA: TolC family protein, partial [Isosphaeraceae bacterium]|nr:TolC family protein [Isosphaeraceae bacterium]
LLAVSGGTYGGGSNLVNPVMGNFAPRTDFDTFAYWSLLNMGAGNAALIKIARAHLGVTQFQELAVLDMVRDEVAEAYAGIHARFAQIGDQEQAVKSGFKGFDLDLARIRQAVPEPGKDVARPIEVLDSLRLLNDSLQDYLDAIVDYNQAHFQLYVALGQPPADCLARPIPTGGVIPAPNVTSGPLSPQPREDAVPPPPPAPSGPGPFLPVPAPSAPERLRP